MTISCIGYITYLVCYSKEFELLVIIFGVKVKVLLLFHQAPHVEKESGAEEVEDIADSQEPFWKIPQIKNGYSQFHTASSFY